MFIPNQDHQQSKPLRQFDSETVKSLQVARSKAVRNRIKHQRQSKTETHNQPFSELMMSERFLALKAYFESTMPPLPNASEHKSTPADETEKAFFLASCSLWWEERLMPESLDESHFLRLQDIFRGLDSFLMKQKARQNPWFPNEQR